MPCAIIQSMGFVLGKMLRGAVAGAMASTRLSRQAMDLVRSFICD